MRIVLILTQPALRTDPLLVALRGQGVEVAQWPMSRLEPEPGLDWEALFDSLPGARWVILPSPGVVSIVMSQLAARARPWPVRVGLAVMGPGSRAEIERWTVDVPGLGTAPVIDPSAPPFDAAALLAVPELARLSGQRVVVLRRADGRSDWLAALRERGAQLEPVVVYRSVPLAPPAEAAGWLTARAASGAPVAFSVTSVDVATRLGQWIHAQPRARWALTQPCLAVHERIAQALRAQGWQRVRVHAPGQAGLLRAVEWAQGSAP